MHDGWEYFEDGERIELTHLECKLCGERVKPGYTADDTPQYIQGIRRCTINGVSVSKEEFERRLKAATEGSI
jgi:hypothetical protein